MHALIYIWTKISNLNNQQNVYIYGICEWFVVVYLTVPPWLPLTVAVVIIVCWCRCRWMCILLMCVCGWAFSNINDTLSYMYVELCQPCQSSAAAVWGAAPLWTSLRIYRVCVCLGVFPLLRSWSSWNVFSYQSSREKSKQSLPPNSGFLIILGI